MSFPNKFSPRRILAHHDGYSLIATAIMIMVLGLIGGAMINMLELYSKKKSITQTQESVSQVTESLRAFQSRHGRYPCPARLDAHIDTPHFGFEVGEDCTSAPLTGTYRSTGRDGEKVRTGTVPVRTLGLPDKAMFDAYGKRLIYAVTEVYAVRGSVVTDNRAAIRVEDLNGNSATQEPGTAIFLVMSHGQDNNGAISMEGALMEPCDHTKPSGKNCDHSDATFVNSAQKSFSTDKVFSSRMDYVAFSCRAQSETRIAACPVGYDGEYMQTRLQPCPGDPWGTWTPTSPPDDACIDKCATRKPAKQYHGTDGEDFLQPEGFFSKVYHSAGRDIIDLSAAMENCQMDYITIDFTPGYDSVTGLTANDIKMFNCSGSRCFLYFGESYDLAVLQYKMDNSMFHDCSSEFGHTLSLTNKGYTYEGGTEWPVAEPGVLSKYYALCKADGEPHPSLKRCSDYQNPSPSFYEEFKSYQPLQLIQTTPGDISPIVNGPVAAANSGAIDYLYSLDACWITKSYMELYERVWGQSYPAPDDLISEYNSIGRYTYLKIDNPHVNIYEIVEKDDARISIGNSGLPPSIQTSAYGSVVLHPPTTPWDILQTTTRIGHFPPHSNAAIAETLAFGGGSYYPSPEERGENCEPYTVERKSSCPKDREPTTGPGVLVMQRSIECPSGVFGSWSESEKTTCVDP